MTTSELSRRSVLAGAAVTVVGGIAGYAVARNSSAAKQKRGTTAANAYGPPAASGTQPAAGAKPLATLAQIPTGGGVILSKQSIVLTRSVDGSVHAFSAVCTHQGCTVDKVSGGTIRCPCHGSTFDAATGAVTGGPAPSPLPTIAVAVRDGGVYRA
jgi:Rieske Fe-S protein